MVVDELGNSFSEVAIAGYYGSARVALFVDLWKYVKDVQPGSVGREVFLCLC